MASPENKKAKDVAISTLAVWALAVIVFLYVLRRTVSDLNDMTLDLDTAQHFLVGITLFGLLWATSVGLSIASLNLPPQQNKAVTDVRIALITFIAATPIAPILLSKFVNNQKLSGLLGAGLLLGGLGLSATQVAMIEK